MELLIATVEQLYIKAEKHYNRKFTRPIVEINLKGRTAGYAHYSGKLQFNPILYKENVQEFLAQTLPHEIAHLIAVELYGFQKGKGHGAAWQSVMVNCFNRSPDRCHKYDVSNSTVRTVKRVYQYECSCRIHTLTAVKHNRILKGARYRCAFCKTEIKYNII
jgi:SprT protein